MNRFRGVAIPRASRAATPVVAGSGVAAAEFWQVLARERREELWLLALHEDYRRKNLVLLSRGSSGNVELDREAVFRALDGMRSRTYVVAHNHPSGDLWPSMDDWMATADLLRDSDARGYDCVDHLILGGGRYVSLRELNAPLFEQYES